VDIRPLFGPSGRLNQDIFHETGADFVEVGSSRIYAAVMQSGAATGSLGAYSGVKKNGHAFGGAAPRGDIPARPFLGVSSEDEANILAEVAEAIADALGG
jgi:phage gpG-like protein